jgi:hypothetical protein
VGVSARVLGAFAALLAANVCAAPPASAAKLCAWQIPAAMVDTVESRHAKAGWTFRFRTTDDAQTPDGTKIPAGTPGYGVIRSADAAGRHNHDGSLSLEPRYVLVRGAKGAPRRVPVTMNPTLPVVWTPSEPLLNRAASHVPLPIPGLVMTGVNEVRWGRNITLGPGFKFSVLPVDDLTKGPIC